MFLTITVLTYRRPVDLAAIVPLLVDEALSVRSDDLQVEILIVDNDPDAGARIQVAEIARRSTQILIRYELEPIPGISSARNRALDSTTKSDLLVFIDDDERPRSHWLVNLLAAKKRYQAAAVVRTGHFRV
ncbi:glycosyltransferase family 2 protein [Arthrobacter psychrolactophilus]